MRLPVGCARNLPSAVACCAHAETVVFVNRLADYRLLVDVLRFVSLGFRSRSQPAAENLYLRKQLALYAERGVRPRRADDATRVTLVVLARLIDWRAALTIVNQTRSFAGIARDSASFGGGSHRRAGGRRSRSTCSA